MGQVLHGSARTTAAVRRAIQPSQESLNRLAVRHGINPDTVAKRRKRSTVEDRPMGLSKPRSSVLTPEQEAFVVAFRKHTLLPLDDCLYALQATIPALTRSALHRCLQRHGISRLPTSLQRRRSSRSIRSAISISTSPRYAQKRVSCVCSSPSTEPPSSSMPNCTPRQARWKPLRSCAT